VLSLTALLRYIPTAHCLYDHHRAGGPRRAALRIFGVLPRACDTRPLARDDPGGGGHRARQQALANATGHPGFRLEPTPGARGP
jgi:hypothetical protein